MYTAQKGKLDIAYTVSLSDTSSPQFHVTTDIKEHRSSHGLDLSFAEHGNARLVRRSRLIFKNVSFGFGSQMPSGKVLPHTIGAGNKPGISHTKGNQGKKGSITIYRATGACVLNQAKRSRRTLHLSPA
jgi:hypothetical protein